jgi:thioredoxin
MARNGGFHPVVVVCALIMALYGSAHAQYGGGSGEPNDPYLIYTPQQMNAIGADPNDWDKHFQLMADLDLSQYTGTEFNLIGRASAPFTGTFDGDDHAISGFSYISERSFNTGLFRMVDEPKAEIRNLGLIAPRVDAGTGCDVGALVGDLGSGTLTNCYTEGGAVFGNCRVGGLVGRLGGDRLATIADCHTAGVVVADDYVGGLAGWNSKGALRDSHSTCAVGGHTYVGGLLGGNAGDVSDCYSAGTVNGSWWDVGGLVGVNKSGVISNSFATGDVTGGDWVGGLVGEHIAGTITECHASSIVVGDEFIGGLVGVNRSAVIDCHASGDVTGDAHIGGLVGVNGDIVTHSWSRGAVSGDRHIGGLVGYNPGTISNSYSAGPVIGCESVGGLAGDSGGAVVNSHSTGPATGEDAVGGLVGHQANLGIIANSYSIGSVNGGAEHVGGLVGDSTGRVSASFWDTASSLQAMSDGGEGLTTPEMQDRQTFTDAGWDFVGEEEDGPCEIWQMPAGGGYPLLGSFNGYAPSDPCGEGSPDCPYLLRSPADLSLLYHCPGGCFRLTSDIDLAEVVWPTAPIPVFFGSFEGAYHRITNMTIRGGGPFGLFAHVGQTGVVLNLRIEDTYISGKPFLLEWGDRVGALAGLNAGLVSGCYADGDIRGVDSVGLLVGENRGVISSCCSTGDAEGYENVGGLVGANWADISRSYSMASVSGYVTYGGGLVGYNGYGALISNSYSTGSVSDDRYLVGGLLGWDGQNDVTGCFWDVETSGMTKSAGGVGLTTAEMQTASTFLAAGWDFVDEVENGAEDLWYMPAGDYPRLAWELEEVPVPAAEVIELDGTNFDETIAHGVVLVDFYATWCSYCVMQAPILEDVAEQVQGIAQVAKLDFDEARRVAQAYGVTAIPTLIVFKDGEVFERFVGLTQAPILVAAIERALDP